MPLGVRLRQAVLVAADLDAVAGRLREALGLGEPFADPGVGEFGLRNAVFAIGDTFLEVVSPVRPGTAAGRHLERLGGDGGYMAIFQLDDLEAARERVADLGIRVVWQIDLPDISGTHLHPADVPGAIVSLDRPDPPQSWRWGGPDWTGRAGEGAAGRIAGATIAVADPERAARRWAAVLGLSADGTRLELDGGELRFARHAAGRGLSEVLLEGVAGAPVDVGGVRFLTLQEG